MLFGKIDGRSDGVDVANHTLEQLVYTDESETRCSYAAVYSLLARTGTSGAYDRGRDMNQIMKTVKLDKRGSADSGPRKVREMTGYRPEDAGETLGKPRVSAGGMLAPERHKLNSYVFRES